MQVKYFSLISMMFLIFLKSMSYSQLSKEDIKMIYDFKASEISGADMLKKQNEIDLFWYVLRNDSTNGFSSLKKELSQSDYPSYFYFDMANFLSIFSPQDHSDIQNALSHVKWEDMRTWEYVEKLRSFSASGIDVSSAVTGLLNQSKLKIKHEITGEQFNQGKLLGYMLLPAERHDYMLFMDHIFDTLNPESQRSIITLFWMANTQKSDELLNAIATNKRSKKLTDEVVLYADRLLKHFSPNQEEKNKYDVIPPDERSAKLIHDYNKAIQSWTEKSWDNLIQSTKLMHYYQVKLEN